MNNRFIVVDLETTGNKPGKDKIIQIGAILIENGEIVERLSSFVNPNMKLTPFIKQFTGIDDEMLDRAPTFSLIAPMLLEMMEDAYFVAHNVPFDFSFLQKELLSNGLELKNYHKIDTVELVRILFPTLNGYKLNQLAEEFNIAHDQPHRADSDAEVTAELLLLLINKLQSLPITTLHKLKSTLRNLHSDFQPLLTDLVNERKYMKNDDEVKYDVYRGLALKQRSALAMNKLGDTEPLAEIHAADALQLLTNGITHYEVRSGQREMVETVEAAFQDHHHGLIEAGTGTGKTVGYLVPAVLHAKKSGRPVVISTYTTQLQEQMMTQEIQYMKASLPFFFQASVMKGRNHYLCLRKFEQHLVDSSTDNYDTALTKAQILVWLTETITGDVDELNLSSGGSLFWNKVKSDSNSCYNHKCPWYSRCYYQRKRKEAEHSDILIVNHALLFADIKSDFSILPKHSELIIDEAHHIEDSISEKFGSQLDYFYIQTILNQLGVSDGNELISKVRQYFYQYELNDFDYFRECDQVYLEVKAIMDELFRNIREYVVRKNNRQKNEIGRISYRYDTTKESGSLWKEIKNNTFIAMDKLEDLIQAIKSLVAALHVVEDQMTFHEKGIFSDFKSNLESLGDINDNLCKLLFEKHTNHVTWAEIEPKGALNASYLYSQPIDCSELLAQKLFAKKQSVVLTSATLAIRDSFDYIRDSLGLYDFEVMTKSISSPFSYKDQVKLMIPNDMPQIKDVEQDEYIQELADRILRIAHISQGRMLILFTSYDMLEKTYQRVKVANENASFVLIAQGISSGSRAKLTKNFKQYEQAILFGTSSFWEGIDIPGEDLSCIVIARLPFSPPNHPVMAAKADWLKQEGKNSFMQLYLPQAIIRFKQGFGRLVRAKNDRGVVIVLDQRILSKSYGKKFISALPAIETVVEPTENLLEQMADWL